MQRKYFILDTNKQHIMNDVQNNPIQNSQEENTEFTHILINETPKS